LDSAVGVNSATCMAGDSGMRWLVRAAALFAILAHAAYLLRAHCALPLACLIYFTVSGHAATLPAAGPAGRDSMPSWALDDVIIDAGK